MSTASDSKPFRQALGCFPTGVTVITARGDDGADVGVTANSFNSVSLDPPMVLWSIGKASANLAAFLAARHFAVHVLALDQEPLARRFAARGTDRFAGLPPLARGQGGVALLDGCAARFECGMRFQYEGGDHVILVGEVLVFESSEREPLLYAHGRYASALLKPAAP